MNCIIVDDEFPAREELKYFIQNFSNINIEKEFTNGKDALKYIENNKTDIAFLDINMPGITGMEFAKICEKENKIMKIIFITAYKEFAVDAFEIHAFDYLLKPYSKERIISALERIENDMDSLENKEIEKISVMQDNKIYVIDINTIYYVEAAGHYVRVFTADKEYISKNKITEIEYIIKNKSFYKCHRSYIVNMEKVKEIKPWFNGTSFLVMNNNKEIPISRNNIKELKKMLAMK